MSDDENFDKVVASARSISGNRSEKMTQIAVITLLVEGILIRNRFVRWLPDNEKI